MPIAARTGPVEIRAKNERRLSNLDTFQRAA